MVDEKNNPNPSSEGPGFKSVLLESRDSGSDPEPVIGRRKAPTRWDHPGMTLFDIRIRNCAAEP